MSEINLTSCQNIPFAFYWLPSMPSASRALNGNFNACWFNRLWSMLEWFCKPPNNLESKGLRRAYIGNSLTRVWRDYFVLPMKKNVWSPFVTLLFQVRLLVLVQQIGFTQNFIEIHSFDVKKNTNGIVWKTKDLFFRWRPCNKKSKRFQQKLGETLTDASAICCQGKQMGYTNICLCILKLCSILYWK